MIVVVCGPGGVGKGTLVAELVAHDPRLWLSRSWTTRPPRPGEDADAYTFVGREEFLERVAAGGFLEWAEFLDNLYGTPFPDVREGRDVLLEIEVQGAEQVKARYPQALVILLVPPSPEVQMERLRRRGDDPDAVRQRVEVGRDEVARAKAIADHVVVNDDLGRAVAEVAGIICDRRSKETDG